MRDRSICLSTPLVVRWPASAERPTPSPKCHGHDGDGGMPKITTTHYSGWVRIAKMGSEIV